MATIHPSQPRTLSSRHKKVDELVRMYSGVKEPSAPLRDVLSQPERASLLIYALGRQILLIKNRSLAFDDGEITLYDRALLVLSLDGKDLADIGALELFATEYLGGLASAHEVALENKVIDVQHALDKVSKFYEKEVDCDMAASTDNQEEPPMTSFFHKHHADRIKNLPSATSQEEQVRKHREDRVKYLPSAASQEEQGTEQSYKNTDSEVNERLNRMLAIYYRAKEDYNRVHHYENADSFNAVRFLRDTTENTIIYLRTKGLVNHVAMAELEETFQYSKEIAAGLSGGRKRHFDDDYPENAVNALPVGRKRHGPKRRKTRPRRGLIDSYRPM